MQKKLAICTFDRISSLFVRAFRSALKISSIVTGVAVLTFSSSGIHAAMHTPGQFNVSPMGAATYTIPIQTAPGTAGMAPQLSLSFNSQSSAGLMGRGWSLGGLSSITRCAQTIGQDNVLSGSINFDTNDRFCLDGQRLVVSNGGVYGGAGTEYRTERESFSRIVSYGMAGNGPAWFKVWTKAGRIIEYGNSADSRIEAQGTLTARVWALNREQDIKSNYFTVSYTEDSASGDFYPMRIDYTGNVNVGMAPNNSVRFKYEALPLIIPMYQAGSLEQATVRLKNVEVYSDAARVLDYRLSYLQDNLTQRSRLTGITQCDGAGASCLPTTTFNWQEPGAFAQTPGSWIGTGSPVHPLSSLHGDAFLALDLNGDGKTDLVQQGDRNGTLWLLPIISNGSGFTLGSWFNTGLTGYQQLLVADINGDGLYDLVGRETGENSISITSIFSTGSGFSMGESKSYFHEKFGEVIAMDIDGDGKTDIVEYQHDQFNGFELWASVSKSNGVGYNYGPWKKINSRQSHESIYGARYPVVVNLIPLDINGDGKMDLVETWTERDSPDNLWLLPLMSNGTDLLPGTWQDTGVQWRFDGRELSDQIEQVIALDMNGDGLSDLMLAGRSYNSNETDAVNMHPFYSNGVGFVKGNADSLNKTTYTNPAGTNALYMLPSDINGDGKTDLLQIWYGRWSNKLYIQPVISQGNGFLTNRPFQDTNQVWNSVYETVLDSGGYQVLAPIGPGLIAVDINGDGKMDLVQQKYNGENDPVSLLPYLADSGIGDLMISVENGLGEKISITHKPLTDPQVHIRDTASSYPLVNIQMPLYVVASIDQTNGLGGIETVRYNYGGLKKDTARSGLAGFRWKEEQLVSTGLVNHTEYRQDWPYTGMVEKASKKMAGRGNAGVLSESNITFGCVDVVHTDGCSITPGRIYFTYPGASTISQWDLNGAALAISSVSTQYDTWGNPVTVSSSVSGNAKTFGAVTQNTYAAADIDQWLIGQLTRTTVTNTIPAYSGILPVPATVIDPGNIPSIPGNPGNPADPGNGGGNGTTPGAGVYPSTTVWVTDNSQPLSVYLGKPINLTVQVSGKALLSGTVTFSEGGMVFGVGSVDASGKSSLSVTPGKIGPHRLTASYSGNVNNMPSSVDAVVTVTFDMTAIMMILFDD